MRLVFLFLVLLPNLAFAQIPKLGQGGTGNTSYTAGKCVRISDDGTKLESDGEDCQTQIQASETIDCTGVTDSKSALQTLINNNPGAKIVFKSGCHIKLSSPGTNGTAITLKNNTTLYCEDSTVRFIAEGKQCNDTSDYPGGACSVDADCTGGSAGACSGTQFAPNDADTYTMIGIETTADAIIDSTTIKNCVFDANQISPWHTCETGGADAGRSCDQRCSGLVFGIAPYYCQADADCSALSLGSCVGDSSCSQNCTDPPNNPAGPGEITVLDLVNGNAGEFNQILRDVTVINHKEGAVSIKIGSGIIENTTTSAVDYWKYTLGTAPLPSSATISVVTGTSLPYNATYLKQFTTYGASYGINGTTSNYITESNIASGASGIGINLTSNTTIRDTIVSGGTTGVVLTTGGKVKDSTITGTNGVVGTTSSNIIKNTITASGSGIGVQVDDNSTVESNTINGGAKGIWIPGTGSWIRGNSVGTFSTLGIGASSSSQFVNNSVGSTTADTVCISALGGNSLVDGNIVGCGANSGNAINLQINGWQNRVVNNHFSHKNYSIVSDARGRCPANATSNPIGVCTQDSDCGGSTCAVPLFGNTLVNNNRFVGNTSWVHSEALSLSGAGWKVENNYYNLQSTIQRRCGNSCVNYGEACSTTDPTASDGTCGTCANTDRQCIAPAIISLMGSFPDYGSGSTGHPIIIGNLFYAGPDAATHANIRINGSDKRCTALTTTNPLGYCSNDSDCGGGGGSCGTGGAVSNALIQDNLFLLSGDSGGTPVGIGIDFGNYYSGSSSNAQDITIKSNAIAAGVSTAIYFPLVDKFDHVDILGNTFDQNSLAVVNWNPVFGNLFNNVYYTDATQPSTLNVYLLNGTGSAAVPGQIVDADTAANEFNGATSLRESLGVVESDCANGDVCAVAVAGVTLCNVPDTEVVAVGNPLTVNSSGEAIVATQHAAAFAIALSAHSSGGDPDTVRCQFKEIPPSAYLGTLRFDFGSTPIANSDWWIMTLQPYASTITRIACESYTSGGSFAIKVCDSEDVDDDICGTEISSSITCDNTGGENTSPTNATIAANHKVSIVINGAPTGSPTKGEILIEGTPR